MASFASMLPLLRPYVRNCPDQTLGYWLREAARDFCAETKFVRESIVFSALAGQNFYQVASPFTGQEIVGIKAAQYNRCPLTPRSFEEVPSCTGIAYGYMWEPPQGFWLLGTPESDAENAISISVWLQPSLTSNTCPEQIFRQYRQTIADGAMAKLFKQKDASWYDAAHADEYQRLFDMTKAKARSVAAKGHRPYAFRTIPGF